MVMTPVGVGIVGAGTISTEYLATLVATAPATPRAGADLALHVLEGHGGAAA